MIITAILKLKGRFARLKMNNNNAIERENINLLIIVI